VIARENPLELPLRRGRNTKGLVPPEAFNIEIHKTVAYVLNLDPHKFLPCQGEVRWGSNNTEE
jgi:hypothetical protein